MRLFNRHRTPLKNGVPYARKRRGPCPACHYIGNRHLCGCMGRLGEALDGGNLAEARSLYEGIVRRANAEENDARNWCKA